MSEMNEMVAAVFHGAGDVRIENVSLPKIGPDEVLLRVLAVGVCGTDAHEYASGPHMFPIHRGHHQSGHSGPMVLGHEISGEVVEVGSAVRSFTIGDLVVSGAGVACGECLQCQRGRTNLCQNYWTIGLQKNGGAAGYVAVPSSTLFDASGLSPDLAGIAQPMSIAVHAVSRGRVASDEDVVILGVGGIGAFLTVALSEAASTVAALDLDAERLVVAERNGADFSAIVEPGLDIQALKQQWGIRPTVIFEVSGTSAGLRSALEWLEPGGRLVLVGLQDGEATLDLRKLSLIEYEVIGTNAHVAAQDMPEALRILREVDADWSLVAPEIYPLNQLVDQGLLPMVERRATRIKTLIGPHENSVRATAMNRTSGFPVAEGNQNK
jgi:(R,R)-butanediol dehydrogenase/meso-butanediol dehydrogenase/diacetyl reductase